MVKLDEATVTSQGQISVPRKVREKLHLQRGDKIVFLEDEKGRVYIEEAESLIEFSADEWRAFLAKTEKEPVTRVRGKAAALQHLRRITRK